MKSGFGLHLNLPVVGVSAQVKVFVTGLFSLNQDIPAFKEHLRDFLVQIKVSRQRGVTVEARVLALSLGLCVFCRSLRARTRATCSWRKGKRLYARLRRRSTSCRCPCPESLTPTSCRRRCVTEARRAPRLGSALCWCVCLERWRGHRGGTSALGCMSTKSMSICK